ncbi:hypothetical protein HYV11_02555 [Candidatus Dependentiae bacterium]|nr:hypothetical protein [Candidatus Dependentiae bacterium]
MKNKRFFIISFFILNGIKLHATRLYEIEDSRSQRERCFGNSIIRLKNARESLDSFFEKLVQMAHRLNLYYDNGNFGGYDILVTYPEDENDFIKAEAFLRVKNSVKGAEFFANYRKEIQTSTQNQTLLLNQLEAYLSRLPRLIQKENIQPKNDKKRQRSESLDV